MSIRKKYNIYGIDTYYKDYHNKYRNPHIKLVKLILQRNIHYIKGHRHVLDMCCGNGEVTLELIDEICIDGCDPYMFEEYINNTHKICQKCSFDDIIDMKLDGVYDLVICSCGLHLCDSNKLKPLVSALHKHNNVGKLMVITPNGRPSLDHKIIACDKVGRLKMVLYDLTKSIYYTS